MANCRKCTYYESMKSIAGKAPSNPKYETIYAMLLEHYARTGHKPLGYCWKRHAPITHYTGKCRHYKPRQIHQHRLTEYIQV